MKNARLLLFFVLSSFLLVSACDGCNGCGDDVDAAADTRINELSALLPADTDAAIVVPELGQLAEHLDYAVSRYEQFEPEARAMEMQLNRQLGLRITDAESWDAAGFNLDGTLMFSMVGSRPVMTAHIDDKNAFQTHFIGRLRTLFGTTTSIEKQTYGDRSFSVSGNARNEDDMAWFYDDSVIVLVMPPFDSLDLIETGTAVSVANKLGTIAEGESLNESPAFSEFRQGVGDEYPLSIFIDASRYFDRPSVDAEALGFQGLDTIVESLVEWSHANTKGAGIGARAGDQRIELHAFAGGDKDLIDEARAAYTTEQNVNWEGMLTENTTIAARTGVDLPKAYRAYLDNLPDSDRRTLEREINLLGRNYQLDIEEDVIGAISGHNLLVFYGVGGNIDRAVQPFLQGRIDEGIRAVLGNSGLMANFHVSDPDKMGNLLDLVGEFGGDQVERRAVSYEGEDVDGLEVFEPVDLNAFPLRLFSSTEALTLTTAGIGEGSSYEYLSNNREEAHITDAEGLALGAQFADSDGLNGLYVNFANLRSNIRQFRMLSGYANELDPLHEFLMTAGVDDNGFYLKAVLDFTAPLEADDDEQ